MNEIYILIEDVRITRDGNEHLFSLDLFNQGVLFGGSKHPLCGVSKSVQAKVGLQK